MNKDIFVFKIIFGIAWGVSFVMMIGFAGGLECGLISYSACAIYELVCIAVMYLSYFVLLKLDEIKCGRKYAKNVK